MSVIKETAFVAEGQSTGTAAGFSTRATHIGVGVDVYGNTVGVHGKGGSVGVHGEGEQTGVIGKGKIGFHAVGGTGTRFGVLAGNADIGANVSGSKVGTWSFGPVGVLGQGDKRAGVFGQGVGSPGAAGVLGLGSRGEDSLPQTRPLNSTSTRASQSTPEVQLPPRQHRSTLPNGNCRRRESLAISGSLRMKQRMSALSGCASTLTRQAHARDGRRCFSAPRSRAKRNHRLPCPPRTRRRPTYSASGSALRTRDSIGLGRVGRDVGDDGPAHPSESGLHSFARRSSAATQISELLRTRVDVDALDNLVSETATAQKQCSRPGRTAWLSGGGGIRTLDPPIGG
jgi:hypothetical protein